MSRAAARAVGLAAALLAAAMMAGCASLSAPGADAGDSISGRLSVQVEGDAERSFNAAFELAGSPSAGSLSLSTPLGTQVARAQWTAEEVRLRSRGSERIYSDLDSLSEDALGERVPLAALFDWLRGRAWPGAPSRAQPQGFAQLGWDIDLSRYREGWVRAERREPAPLVTVRAKLDETPPQ